MSAHAKYYGSNNKSCGTKKCKQNIKKLIDIVIKIIIFKNKKAEKQHCT